MDFEKICAWCYSYLERFRSAVAKQFDSAVKVGNPEHALKKGEQDGDDERLSALNRTWREMLKEDPWMKVLMVHVHLLVQVSLVFFVVFFVGGMLLEARHPIFTIILACFAATIPYWLWIGSWNRKIESKVFAEFRKRFGKHFHLK